MIFHNKPSQITAFKIDLTQDLFIKTLFYEVLTLGIVIRYVLFLLSRFMKRKKFAGRIF